MRNLTAFVHIEKAAGTTLIHILRRIYFGQYIDVRPLTSKGTKDMFTFRDFTIYSRLNPFIRCIGGHSVRPCSDLDSHLAAVHYLTVLRDPCARYLSQYYYWNQELGRRVSLSEFVKLDDTHNFQTRKLCGKPDPQRALQVIMDKFLCVGLAEQFDTFLVVLASKLGLSADRLAYEKKNVGRSRNEEAEAMLAQHERAIMSANSADIELYEAIKSEVIPRQRTEYGPKLDEDVAEYVRTRTLSPRDQVRTHLDWLYRKTYITPASNVIRTLGGLPARGSYATH